MDGFLDDVRNNFLATGVGSMPHGEAKDAVNAVFDAFSYHIPFWPQLPRRSFYENMYVQFSEKFPGVEIDLANKSIRVNTQHAAYMSDLEDCFNKCQAADIDYFAISRAYAEGLYLMTQRLMGSVWKGWVKTQVIGPISLGLSLLDEEKNPILYNAELSDLLPLFLSMKASWLVKQFKVHAKTRVIVFVDEPYLVAVGTSQCALPRARLIEMINGVVRVIHESGALAGIHCCGNTDWEMIMATDIDILNFDAFGYWDKLVLYEKALNNFFKRRGMLAIGIVPTEGDLSRDGLALELFSKIKKHAAFLKNGALITSSCGLSGMSEGSAVKSLDLCAELSERLRGEF